MLWQAAAGRIPIEAQFFLDLLADVLAAGTEASLLTLVFTKHERKRWKKNIGYFLFLVMNFLFILWESWTVILIFLVF